MDVMELRRKAIMNHIGDKILIIPSDNRYVSKISKTINFYYMIFKDGEIIYIVHEAQYDYSIENEKYIITFDPEKELSKIIENRKAYSTIEKIGNLNFDLMNISKFFKKPFDEEIPVIMEGIKILMNAFYDAATSVSIGVKENELRAEIDYRLIKGGMEDFVYPTVVVSGKMTSVPFSRTSEKKIEKGDIVQVDISPIYKGYELSIARVIFTETNNEILETWNFYNKVFEIATKYFQRGIKCNLLDEVVRNYIAEKNIIYPHYTGYPSGGFSSPYIYPNSEDVLERNSLFIFSPGIYFKNRYGFRIKRTVLIKDYGFEFLDRE